VSIQQEIMPRLSVDFGYFRRWFGNFTVVDNRAVGPNDYTRYSITAPVDSRLALSGQTITGLYDQTGNIGNVDNYTTFADSYGNMIEHWNGFDLTINARPRSGIVLQGGFNIGRTTTDNCSLRAALPEITILAAGVAPRQTSPATIGLTAIPDRSCRHRDPPATGSGASSRPKIDVQFGRSKPRRAGGRGELRRDASPDDATVPLTGGCAGQRRAAWPGVRQVHPATRHALLEDPPNGPDSYGPERGFGQHVQFELHAGHHDGVRKPLAVAGQHHGPAFGQAQRAVRFLDDKRLERPLGGGFRREVTEAALRDRTVHSVSSRRQTPSRWPTGKPHLIH
jgi:hypothetical protein